MRSKDIHSLLDKLSLCTSTPGQGVTRLSYSQEDQQAKAILAERLTALGLPFWNDKAGNLHAHLAGRDAELPPLFVGSHLDTVRNGGKYDGAVGVVGALAVLERLTENGRRPLRNVRFIAFAEEEGSNFNLPLLGSRILAGELQPTDLAGLRDRNGRSFAKVTQSSGLTCASHDEPAASRQGFMLELHIEQGNTLAAAGISTGVVSCIVASHLLTVELQGQASHSGTTPTHMRRDALAGMAAICLACEELAKSDAGKGSVITVGHVACEPNSFNCVAGKAVFTIDLRHVDRDSADRISGTLTARVNQIAAERGLGCRIAHRFTPGAEMDADMAKLISETASRLGLRSMTLPSHAMHDAGVMARIARAGMIFVPSRDGLSHNPNEFSEETAIEDGINLLFSVALGIAGCESPAPRINTGHPKV